MDLPTESFPVKDQGYRTVADIDHEIVSEGLRFPEGPIAMPDGSVLIVEINGKTLTRVNPNGGHQMIAELQGGPNGAAIGPDGACYICNSGGWVHDIINGRYQVVGQSDTTGWIEKVDLATGKAEILYSECGGKTLRSPNDLVFDQHGGFYFTDTGKADRYQRDVTAVYYAEADGSEIREVARPLLTPNGIGLSADEKILYVAETQTRRIWAFTLLEPGVIDPAPFPSLNGGELVAGLTDYFALDSLAIDSAGHICVGSLRCGGFWDISPDGSERVYYPFDDAYCTNICFGGADLQTAYLTLSATGRLAKMRWPRPGLPLNFLNRVDAT